MKAKKSIIGIIAWCFYDWANSAFPTLITTFVFAAYFTQAIVKDPILGTRYWGNAIALAGIIIALLSPLLGMLADQSGRCKPWLAFFTLLTVISSALLWFATPSHDSISWALTWVILGTIGLELSMVFYNALLRHLVSNTHLGRVSGWSWALGYAGGLLCLLIALSFIPTDMAWSELTIDRATSVRLSGPLVALWLTLFSLPLFLLTPDRKTHGITLTLPYLFQIVNQFFRNLHRHKPIALFLLAHMIYIDGLNTLFAFGGIYAAGTFAFRLTDIIWLGLGMNISAGIGAFLFAWLDDYCGSKTVILLALLSMIISGIVLLLIHSTLAFWICALWLALFIGPVQSASRSLLTHTATQKHLAEAFGLYALSGKATAFLGPWLVALITTHFGSQRAGMATIIVFLMVGALLLTRVHDQRIWVEQ